MKRLDKHQVRCEFEGEDGELLKFSYDNRGNPFSEGGTIELDDGEDYVMVYLKTTELRALHETIGKMLDAIGSPGRQDAK